MRCQRDIMLSQYHVSQILGISTEEVRELAKQGVFGFYELDMRGRYKISMREVNRLNFALREKGKSLKIEEERFK
jgi:hypothetical protein